MDMKKIRRYWLTMAAALTLTGCDRLAAQFAGGDELELLNDMKPKETEAIQVHNVVFSPDHKTFTITTQMSKDIGPYSLLDTTMLKIRIENEIDGIRKTHGALPTLIGQRNVKAENILKSGTKVLALVDATLPQSAIDRIHDYMIELRAVFNHDNLFVAFMHGQTVSETIRATDYVMANYFKKATGDSVFLYRAILEKKHEMTGRQGPWADARNMALLVFSDDEVYQTDSDSPIDPEYYRFEEQMVHHDGKAEPHFLVSYASMNTRYESGENQASIVLKLFCESTHGIYMKPYNGTDFKNCILTAFNISPDANSFTFENPDGKVYRGNIETLTLNFMDARTDSLVTRMTTKIREGNIYNPIIVNGAGLPLIATKGLLLAGFIMLGGWLLLQLIIPFIRYRRFKRKYVIRYTGANMCIGNTVVQEACYLCKEPFKTGNEVVVRCAHTMHKSCWDENGYHCPEYSDRCKTGSHYYNHRNPLDRHNAPFYLKWIMMAIVAAWLAWLVFIMREHSITHFIVSKVLYFIYGPQEEVIGTLYIDSVSPLPAFGFAIGFFLTLGISLLSKQAIQTWGSIAVLLARALLSAALCYLTFLTANILVATNGIEIVEIIIEIIAWTLTCFIIAFCGTYGTNIVLRKRLILPGIALGVISMYVWWLFYDTDIDYRVLLLLSFIIFAVSLTIGVATLAPRSERFFLRVQGAMKDMDIAVYKWFRNAPDRVVTIGKSVDSSLQMSWDIMSEVAPIQAEIRMVGHFLYLRAKEEGVYSSGKPVKVGKRLWLSHGKSFTIGNTTFTYLEKDLPR